MKTRIALLLPLLLLSACKEDTPAPDPIRPVVSEVITPRIGLQTAYVGTIAARYESDLAFPISGTLAERPVYEGDTVTKDQILAQLDPQSLDADLRAAEAGVTVAEAQLNSASDAEARARELTRRGVESSATAEAAANTLSAARAKLEQARAQLSQARETRGFATMKAPRDGVITTVYVQPGAALTAGQKVLHLAGTDEREAVIDLSDQDVAGLAPGAVFRLRLEAATEIETRATLRVIDPVSDSATRTRRLHLTLAGDAPAAFRLGALVLVEPIDATAARVTLPVSAVLEGADGPHVWVVDPAGRHIHRVAVTTGAVTGDRILVTGGLKPGDEVVTRGIHSLKDGQQVGPRVPA